MKKQRIRTLASLLCLSLLFAGCSPKVKPEEAFQSAIEKNNALTAIDSSITTASSMHIGEESMDFDMEMHMQIDGLNTEEMTFAMNGTTQMYGSAYALACYYENGVYYMDVMGEKLKTPLDLDAAMAQVNASSSLMELAKDCYTNISMSTEGENTVFTYTGDTEKLDNYVDQVLAATSVSLPPEEAATLSMTINSLSGKMTVNAEGYMVAHSVSLDYEMTAEDQVMGMVMTADMTINNPGQPVTPQLPEDLADYREVSPEELGL